MNLSQIKHNIIIDLSLLAIVVIVLIIIGQNIINVITPFIYGLVVAYLLNPIVNLMEKKKIKRIYAILIVFLLIISILAAIFVSFVPKLAKDISVLMSDIPNIFQFVEKLVTEFRIGELSIIPDAIRDFIDIDQELGKLSEMFMNFLGQLSSILLTSTGALLNIILTPIITFYFLKDKKRIVEAIIKWLRKYKSEKIRIIAKDINQVLLSFIKGQLIVATFVGVLTGVGCAVIGVPHALSIGLFAGLTNLIPYFGPWIGGIMPVVIALMNTPITALWVVIWIIIVQQIESSFISPQVMSHSVGLHPLTVIFSVLLFGNIFGIPGMILGVPLTGSIKVLIKYTMEFRRNYRKKSVNSTE